MKSLKTQFQTYLILKIFIQILKSFFLFSVSYSQPKIRILRCDKSTPLNRNLVPRFAETRLKDNVFLQVFTLPQLLFSDGASRSKPTLWRCPLDYDNLDRYLSYVYDYNAFYEPGVVAYSFSWSFGSHILSGLQLNKTFLSSP